MTVEMPHPVAGNDAPGGESDEARATPVG